jgi:hypothetical protein
VVVDLERLTSPEELERVEKRYRGNGTIALPRLESRRPEPSREREHVALLMVRDIDPGPCDRQPQQVCAAPDRGEDIQWRA